MYLSHEEVKLLYEERVKELRRQYRKRNKR